MTVVTSSKSKTPPEEKHEYEFFGPPGAAAIVFLLPLLLYATVFLCNDVSGCPPPALLDPKTLTLEKLKKQTPWPENGIAGLFDLEVTLWVLAYYALSLALQLFLPGQELDGTTLGTGGRHHYKFNAFNSALLILAGLAVGTAYQGADFVVWTYIWDNLPQVVTANLLMSYAQAIYVYLASFSVPHPGQPNPEHRELAKGGHTGNMLYDFFIGRELNPRVAIPAWIPVAGGQVIDIKVFNEMRPGLLNWIILDLAFVAHQYKTYGYMTDSILLVTFFQVLYVMDALYMEPAIMTTIDVISDGFGFMLAFGGLTWVPFIYSLQTRYLAVYPLTLGVTGIAGVLAVQALGYYIFRGANNEKNRFRTNPNDPRVSHLETMTTESGSKLLVSGWWGTARHINYLGDWIMSWSYSLPTGVAGYIINRYQNPVTGNTTREVVQGDARGWGMIFSYFYVIYFGVLLVHRQLRDEEKCRKKYGKDWERYCKRVKWRIIPGIY
ncbi:Delta(14)-sterol reductase [Cladophialophora carrionii]|uniref:Delta(14)-sterol reductase n=1 Tax=Cladophialophora carrionii TaxID=86049 RepID=A0A1C1CXE2_9EURO|nr:Delta(14)-sterol reductase [Cladophialophora carrionii]